MEKYIIAPPAGSQTNALGAKDRPWEEVHAKRYPGLNEYLAESTGYGIVSGCEPSINGLTVTVSAGVIHTADGRRVEVPEQSITLDAADATKPRTDVVYLDKYGKIAKLTGELGTPAVAGSNTYTISMNFAAGDTVTFGGVTFTCTTSTQDATNFVLGADTATSATNLAAALNANSSINAIYTASTSGSVVTITEKSAGGGNTPGAMMTSGTGVVTAGSAVSSTTAFSTAPGLMEAVIKVGEIAIKVGAVAGAITASYNHYKTATITYHNVSMMRQDRTLMPGMVAHTLGYYEPNDGGGAVYVVRGKADSDTDDGGSVFFLDNGNVAEMIIDAVVNVKQFGAKGDGVTDDTAAIQNAINYSISHGKGGVEGSNCIPVVIPNGKYRTTATINITKSLSNWELHAETSIINYEGGDYAFYINRLRYSSLHFGVIDATKAGGCIHFKSIYDGTNNVDWFQYVNIYFDILQAKTDCILSETENKGWGNEVRLFGGRFRAGQYGLRIENNGGTIVTKWGCYNLGIEGVSCGVGLHNNGAGQIWEMLFVNCRTEEAETVLETVGDCKWCEWIDPYPVDYSKFKLSINTRTFKFITGTDYIDIPKNYNIDANSLLNVGSYRIDDWDTARKSTNLPEKSPGILTVLLPDRRNIYYVTQKYTINNSPWVYQRTWKQEDQTWSNWERVDGWSMRFGYKVVQVDIKGLINEQNMSFIAVDNGVVQIRCNGKIVALKDNNIGTIGIGRINNPKTSDFTQYVDSIPVRKGHQVYIETIGVTEATIEFVYNG